MMSRFTEITKIDLQDISLTLNPTGVPKRRLIKTPKRKYRNRIVKVLI